MPNTSSPNGLAVVGDRLVAGFASASGGEHAILETTDLVTWTAFDAGLSDFERTVAAMTALSGFVFKIGGTVVAHRAEAPGGGLFSDGFESAGLGQWSSALP